MAERMTERPYLKHSNYTLNAVANAKDWGQTRCLAKLHTTGFSVHHASIKAGHSSSLHRHHALDNGFYLLSGELTVTVAGEDYALEPISGVLWVLAGVWHQFKAITDCELIEVYVPRIDDDIERAQPELAA